MKKHEALKRLEELKTDNMTQSTYDFLKRSIINAWTPRNVGDGPPELRWITRPEGFIELWEIEDISFEILDGLCTLFAHDKNHKKVRINYQKKCKQV